jgi:hypothetical protein
MKADVPWSSRRKATDAKTPDIAADDDNCFELMRGDCLIPDVLAMESNGDKGRGF